MEGYWVFGFLEKFEINVCEGASAENVEFQHFSNFKTRFSSQWPENPTVCHDIEMAGCLVVYSITQWGWGALKTSPYPLSQLSFFSNSFYVFLTIGKATFRGIRTNVPGFPRIGWRSGEILGRLS